MRKVLQKNNRAHEEVVAGEPEITGLASDFVAVYLAPPRKNSTPEIALEDPLEPNLLAFCLNVSNSLH